MVGTLYRVVDAVSDDYADLRRKAEETFGLSYLDEFWLYKAWGVLKRKVVPMNGNTMLTVLGVLAGALVYVQQALQNGTPIPQNAHDWVVLVLGGVIAGIGALAKGASVGSQPGDPPTPSRIVGAITKGEPVKPSEIAASAAALETVQKTPKG